MTWIENLILVYSYVAYVFAIATLIFMKHDQLIKYNDFLCLKCPTYYETLITKCLQIIASGENIKI